MHRAIGIFGYDRTIKMKDVKDGTREHRAADRNGPRRRAVDSRRAEYRSRGRCGRPAVRRHALPHVDGVQKRVDGFNVLLADASVRFTKPDIAPEVLAALATVAGGEEIPADW